MQTNPVNQKFANKAMQHVPVTPIDSFPLPLVGPTPGLDAPIEAPIAAAPRERVKINPHAELDAMLIGDPNTGSFRGLRFALLFNAGVAVSGLVIWELCSLLIP